jgi:hemoglobin/transferrin/lactoferrin receptor protein
MRRLQSAHRIAALMAGAMLPMATDVPHADAQAQGEVIAARRFTFNIPAQPVPQGLNAIGRVAGFSVVVNGAVPSSIRGNAVSGSLLAQQALASFLSGTGLTYSFTDANTVTVSTSGVGGNDAAATVPGAIALDTIDVGGSADGGSVYTPYEAAAPTSHISAENIERFRGSSPADIFRGTPGVMSGEARNGAGGIDVNIRGMQGMGRVATTVDGAENSLQIYQGYQGLSNRTFVDPDLIASIDITKGSDASSRGIAGTVAMRTVDAGDIVKPGQKWGVRVKGEAGTNTSTPEPGNRAGYQISNPIGSTNDPNSGYGTAVPSPDGLDRPGLLTPTQGSASIVGALKEDNFEFLAGYAYRERGNYHAGKHGPAANPVDTGPRKFCYSSGTCPDYLLYRNYVENGGLSNYRAGEEVLNTQLETESWLTKATVRFGDGHSLKFGYTGYRSEAGDRLASALTSDASQPVQQTQTAGTVLDTGTMRYLWKPAGNDLIDLKANFWVTDLELRNPPRNAYGTQPESIGLAKDYRPGSDTVMWGGDATNTSKLSFDRYGSLQMTYGVSYVNEDTRPSAYTDVIEGWLNLRDAAREEAGAFSKIAYKPLEWLTLNGGLRYSHFWSDDRRTVVNSDAYLNPKPKRDEGGFSPSAGITLEPIKGTQFYVNYSNALRYPSLFESVSAFTIIPNPDLGPERASNWEIGANFQKDGLLVAEDRAMMKLGYFNWDVSDYIAREYRPFEGPGYTWWGMQVYNIDRAKFSGLEFSGRYERGGFTADLAANYYLNIEYCRTSDTCAESSLYGDYATNHVPPKYTVDLTLSQKLFDDALTVGGRVSYVGPRAIEHGLVTAQGLSSFISQINWEPYTLVDLFADYKINDTWTLGARVENVTDQYYVDPLGLVNQPGPGRTFYASLTSTLGGDQSPPRLSSFSESDEAATDVNWTGLYAGFHGGWSFGAIDGTTTALDGTVDPISTSESADLKLDSPVFGAQVGFNRQLSNRVVLGAEADFSWSWFDKSQDAFTKDEWLAPSGDVAGLQAKTHYDIDWMASVRGRLGYAFDNGLLLYGTGGVAFLSETQFRDQYRYENDWSAGERTKLFSVEEASATHTGFTIGGGAEYAINDRWSVKADYSYSQFPDADLKFEDARAGTGIAAGGQTGTSNIVNGRNVSNELEFHSFKTGLNYRF